MCAFLIDDTIAAVSSMPIWNVIVSEMREEGVPAVYILASQRNGTPYIGVTSDPCGRISAHRQGLTPGFTTRYGVKLLVYIEYFGDMSEAIAREKQLKKWRWEWKLALIEKDNPGWRDLFPEICGSDQ